MIVNRVNELIEYKEKIKNDNNLEEKIRNEVMYLGYNISYLGTKYLIQTIKFIASHPNENLQKLEKNVYPVIANKYKDSVYNVKANINRANNAMYYECEIKKLIKYFCLETDKKPTVKMVINTILNKISNDTYK